MKYIKTYDSFNNKIYESEMVKYYWLVPNDERLISSLKKINSKLKIDPMPKWFDKKIKIDYENDKYICIMYIGENFGVWSATPYKSGISEMFKKLGYSYGGEINFYEGEMNSIKYNL